MSAAPNRTPMMPLIRAFAAERNRPLSDITGPCRKRELVALRRDLIGLLASQGYAVNAIARRLERDHSTIHHHLALIRASAPQP